MDINIRCDRLPQPFNLNLEPSTTIDALLDQICEQIELDKGNKDALIIKKGFPPKPVEAQKEQSLVDAGLGPQREKLIVSVDEEMVAKKQAEIEAAQEEENRRIQEELAEQQR